MEKHRIVYTSDIHGNLDQYNKLLEFLVEEKEKENLEVLVLGGDLLPKCSSCGIENLIEKQKRFINEHFFSVLKKIKNLGIATYLIPGNDDLKISIALLREENENLFYDISLKRKRLFEDLEIVGYPYVPITPFDVKDWEKYDLSNPPQELVREYEKRKKENYNIRGIKTYPFLDEKNDFLKVLRVLFYWEDYSFNEEHEKNDSIQLDLEKKIFTKNPDKTLYVIHTPPNNTDLDVTCLKTSSGDLEKEHKGSFAVRLFIEKYQPYITLHGHIHETVRCTGKFMQIIGKTTCITSGNDNNSEELSVILLDLDNNKFERRLL